jgi:hypothetical protein
MQREEIMGHLVLQGDNTTYPGFSLLGESTLTITFDEIGPVPDGLILPFLVLSGTTSVNIGSVGTAGAFNFLEQLEEKTNVLTTVTISGSVFFELGSGAGHSNVGDGVVTDIAATATLPTRIHSSLTLIDASANTGGVAIYAGATNTAGAGQFGNGESLDANVTITYTGLTIKGGSHIGDFIENDAKNGIVTVGNGNNDFVILGGAGAKASLGTGTNDFVRVGLSSPGTTEAAGSCLGDKVSFGSGATAHLVVGTGAEAGPTAGTTSIGLTKVVAAEAGMTIDFSAITNSSNIFDARDIGFAAAGQGANLAATENAVVAGMGGHGVTFFVFGNNEYFIATNHTETAVSSDDAIVKLVGIHDLTTLTATNSVGLVTLHV